MIGESRFRSGQGGGESRAEKVFRAPDAELRQVGVRRQARFVSECAKKVPGAEGREGRQFVKRDVRVHVFPQEGTCLPDRNPRRRAKRGVFAEALEKERYEMEPERGSGKPVRILRLKPAVHPSKKTGKFL